MATVNIALCQSQTQAVPSGTIQIPKSVPISSPVDMTPSGTSAQCSIVAPTGRALVGTLMWEITAYNGPIRVAFGTNPTASATNDRLILAGQTRQFGVSVSDEKVAIINATVA